MHNIRFNVSDTGCHLDSHRGHYISRDAVNLAVGYGFIISPSDQWVLDTYESHSHQKNYPHEAVTELADMAIEWLNSGQDQCEFCEGTGINPSDGDYYIRADSPDPYTRARADNSDPVKRCKHCTGTGQAPRIEGQNFPPRIPAGYVWEFNDGDFGIYLPESDEPDHEPSPDPGWMND